MKLKKWIKSSDRNRGIALIVVVGALALTTVLLLAMFSVTETEYKATQGYVAAQSAKQYADMAVSIVQAQIQNGQNTSKGAARTFHATQPGCVRVYNSAGFVAAYKLYSSSQMAITTTGRAAESDLVNNAAPPPDWDSTANSARYVDLNQPVVRASARGDAANPAIFFPIIDPRAAYNFSTGGGPSTAVEGFEYKKRPTVGTATADIDGVVTPDTADPNKLRIPMPVEWMYVLQDGTVGTLNAANQFIKPDGSLLTAGEANNPSSGNYHGPIVGRVAFWADDESCKINVNTASEPTYMGNPYYFHDRDRRWAHYPAATGEYQRYPGHPATVALSAVLYPNVNLDPVNPTNSVLTKTGIVDVKEQIYNLAPKISPGGSKSGTLPFVVDNLSAQWGDRDGAALHIDLSASRNERLFASVDELLYKDVEFNASTGRQASVIQDAAGRRIFDHNTLERTRFFLTASSRAPEFSIHGLPRVCIWPIADGAETGDNVKRSSFDNTIALCATLRSTKDGENIGSSYIFRRSNPHSATADLAVGGSEGIRRNRKLLEYIEAELNTINYPRTGTGGTTTTFGAKYGQDNTRQLAVEFFDYIRCTNLYDGVLARYNNGTSGWQFFNRNTDGSLAGIKDDLTLKTQWGPVYDERDTLAGNMRTFTNQRMTPTQAGAIDNSGNTGTVGANSTPPSADGTVFPGHGQVTPIIWDRSGKNYMGFGRMFTLSEIGVQIICTADGENDGPLTKPDADGAGHAKDEAYAVDFGGVKRGGGSAPRVDPKLDFPDPNNAPGKGGPAVPTTNSAVYTPFSIPQNAEARWWSNFPPIFKPENLPAMFTYYGVDTKKPDGGEPGPANLHPSRHPAFDPENWNTTLAEATPLLPNEKRIQATILMETFCPMLGWTKFFPEYTIVFKGGYINNIKIVGGDGKKHPFFETTDDMVIKSNGNLYEANDVHSVGGHAGPSALMGGRAGRAVSGEGPVSVGSDPQLDRQSGESWHRGLLDYGLVSNFMTVPRDQPLTIEFPPNLTLDIELYDTHKYQTAKPFQTLHIKMTDVKVPTPALVGSPHADVPLTRANYNSYVNPSDSKLYYYRALQGPHWWTFNRNGALGRAGGRFNRLYFDGNKDKVSPWSTVPAFSAGGNVYQELRGRLDNVAAGGAPTWPTAPGGTAVGVSILPDSTSDVVRTMVPAAGDYRLIAGMQDVKKEMWVKHPMWDKQDIRSVHSFTNQYGSTEPGYKLGVDESGVRKDEYQLVSNAYVSGASQVDSRLPDLPGGRDWASAANSFGDFDTGISVAREGPYVNKPDEGNFYAQVDIRNINSTQTVSRYYRSGYFFGSWRQTDDWRNGVFMTPNRMISSPVMFGSLPTALWDGGAVPQSASALSGTSTFSGQQGRPWQTLLFRPYVQSGPVGLNYAKANHPGQMNPMDHYVLDLFFMPVVEPYAISEPLSEAGKINMNYQMLPFTNIKRATGMHAVLKGEMMTAIPLNDRDASGNPAGGAVIAKGFKSGTITQNTWDTFYNEKKDPTGNEPSSTNDNKFWHRFINPKETLVQFDERFAFKSDNAVADGLLRSASQICEMHLVPKLGEGETVNQMMNPMNPTNDPQRQMTAQNRKNNMARFWQLNSPTGDNIRERPYSNIYSRVTTRSNTFRVHMRAQVIKKARSVDPATFDPAKDAVLSEYRGSALLERYIDPTSKVDSTGKVSALPDYADGSDPLQKDPLDTFYQFRVLETKRFNP